MSEVEPGYGMSIYAKTPGKCHGVSCHYSMFQKYMSQTITTVLKFKNCRCNFINADGKAVTFVTAEGIQKSQDDLS